MKKENKENIEKKTVNIKGKEIKIPKIVYFGIHVPYASSVEDRNNLPRIKRPIEGTSKTNAIKHAIRSAEYYYGDPAVLVISLEKIPLDYIINVISVCNTDMVILAKLSKGSYELIRGPQFNINDEKGNIIDEGIDEKHDRLYKGLEEKLR